MSYDIRRIPSRALLDYHAMPIWDREGMERMPVTQVLQRIDGGHARLKELLDAVAGICPEHVGNPDCRHCPDAIVRECEGLLHDHLGEMLVFMTGHFRFEDSLMRDWQLQKRCSDTCENHQRDHSRLSAIASRMVADLEQGNPLQGIRDLHDLLSHWIDRHIEEHDRKMIHLLQAAPAA